MPDKDESATAEPLEITVDESLTASDLEAEIAASAAALGGHGPRDKKSLAKAKAEAEEVVTEPAKKKIITKKKTVAKKPPVKAVKEESKEDDTAQVIKVRKIVKPEVVAKKGNFSSEGVKIKVSTTVKAPTESNEEEVDEPTTKEEDVATMNHSGKTLTPISSDDDEEDVEAEAKTIEPEEEVNESDDEEDSADEKEEPSEGDETAQKLNAMSGELKAREEDRKNKKDDQQQVKVFDTKKYHLPIKASRHNRKSSTPAWLQILILLIALLGAAAYAVNSGMFDPGFEIPYITPGV